ncbi:hypothetical protein [Methylomonas sp. MK1]|uniref:hypothetical protein n=1 Tax=Methylomonas sp. MK1 TaxID=1131552 RepID=UPI003FA36DF1
MWLAIGHIISAVINFSTIIGNAMYPWLAICFSEAIMRASRSGCCNCSGLTCNQ